MTPEQVAELDYSAWAEDCLKTAAYFDALAANEGDDFARAELEAAANGHRARAVYLEARQGEEVERLREALADLIALTHRHEIQSTVRCMAQIVEEMQTRIATALGGLGREG